jgi:signal transduction histidine kinase
MSAGVVWGFYVGVPILTILAAVVLAGWIHASHWERRGAKTFVAMLGMDVVWMVSLVFSLLELPSDLRTSAFLVQGVVAMLVFAVWVVFVSRYTGRGYHRNPLAGGSLLLYVLGFGVLFVTTPFHDLLIADTSIVSGSFSYVDVERGPGWEALLWIIRVHLVYSLAILVQDRLSAPHESGRQLVLIGLGSLMIPGFQTLGRTVLPARGLSHAAYGVFPFLLLLSVALFRFSLFDLQPVARRAVVENLRDPVVVVDADGRVVDYNEATTGVWPSVQDGIGRPLADVCPDLAEQLGPLDDATETAQQVVIASDGTEYYYSVDVSTADSGGNESPYLYTLLLRDVTDLEESRRRLHAQNERLERVAGTISHDLRNPLSVASGYAEMIADELDDESGTHERVERIVDSHDRMEDIVEDVLTIAREKQTIEEMEAVKITPVARAAWQDVETGDARLVVDADARIEADESRLRSIFENLFRNAVEHGTVDDDPANEDADPVSDGHTSSNQVTVTVGLDPRQSERDAAVAASGRLYVQDDGSGVPLEHRDDLFEYGFSTSEGGTGLGLSIVETMAESHGWTVRLDEEYDDGARFIFDGVTVRDTTRTGRRGRPT